MGTQTWTYLLIGYFVYLAVIIGVLDTSGLMDGSVTTTTNPDVYTYSANSSASLESPPSTSAFSSGGYLQAVWNFTLNWNIDLGIGAWMWIIRIFFVYLPILALVLSVYYSLPFTGGH